MTMSEAQRLVQCVGNTPLIRLNHLSDATSCEILGKAEFMNPGGSVKDRPALGMILEAKKTGALKPGGIIVEGTAGNTGIGLAMVGSALGHRTVVVMPDNQSDEKIATLKAYGAARDDSNVYLEVRAGTGGDEAAIFAGDLFRMYSKYAESMRWSLEIISAREGEHGGYKEIISRISGKGIYARLKFESGAHRVQRVPTTESQGRIHTSACTVAVLPEMRLMISL